ncbi:MAG: sigma-70 family RNA polymerase sigma factor [Acidobacteria bacterium]|nr:sigma-70 family RNA polymerase sigma factor [Acidobacteriota bacterium]
MKPRSRVVDELLVLEAQAGRVEAFERLAALWHPRLLGYAFHLTGDREGAREAVQDAWMSVVRGLSRLRDPAGFPGWALSIARRRCADWVRRRQRSRRGAEGLNDAARLASPTTSSEEQTERLREAIRGLDPESRFLVEMYYRESLSVGEIARVLGIPAGTVKSRLYHVRERLRTILEV